MVAFAIMAGLLAVGAGTERNVIIPLQCSDKDETGRCPAIPIACEKEQDFCTDRSLLVDLPAGPTEVLMKVNASLGEVFTIQLPPQVRIVDAKGIQLGNKAVFESEPTDTNAVLIRPKVPDDYKPDPSDPNKKSVARILLGERTNVQITTDNGWFFDLWLRHWTPSRAMGRLSFISTELDTRDEKCRAQATKALEAREAKLEDANRDLVTRVKEAAVLEMAAATHLQNACNHWGEAEMHDLLWVKKERICAVGDRMYIRFRIRNRARDDQFRVGDVEVVAGEEKSLETVVVFFDSDNERVRMEDVSLRYNEEVFGTVSFPETTAGSSDLKLRVTEASGKGRVVEIEDVGF